MSSTSVQYIFKWPDQKTDTYTLELDENALCTNEIASESPEWAKLEFHQCPSCPLDKASNEYCPIAQRFVDLLDIFSNSQSHDQLTVEVITEQRNIFKETTVQRAISSLLGLIIPTSGCPNTRALRPMAKFHLPLSSEQETVYRVAGMYLLAQYFLNKHGKNTDLELSGLYTIYEKLHEINTHSAKRLRDAATNDSAVNAVILLDMFSKSIPFAVEESLEELRALFQPFFES